MSDPIPGWYPDPEEPSRQRFWDGTQWTEARAYPVAAAPDGTPVAADTGSAGSKNVNGKTIALIVALAVLILFALWFFLLRGGSTPEPAPVVTPTAPQSPTAKPTEPTKAPTAPPVTPTVVPTVPVTPTVIPSP